MRKLNWIIVILTTATLVGCNPDIVTTPRLKLLSERRIYIEPIQSENPQVGQVLRDVIEKEFVRKKFEISDPNTATVFITGSTFMTVRAKSSKTKVSIIGTGSAFVNQAIESVSLIAKDQSGEILLSASYDNKKQRTASKLGKTLGRAVAGKLKRK